MKRRTKLVVGGVAVAAMASVGIAIGVGGNSTPDYSRSDWGSFRVNVDRELRWEQPDCKWAFYASSEPNCEADGYVNNRDHMVAVAEAHRSGGAEWERSKKRDFFSDTSNLFVMSAVENRQKSDSDPAGWKPADASVHCEYAQHWVAVKKDWNLSMDIDEASEIIEMLLTCEGGS